MQPPTTDPLSVSLDEAYAVAKASLADLFVENRLLLRRLERAEARLRELESAPPPKEAR